MGKNLRRIHFSSIFRYILDYLESLWNRTRVSDSTSHSVDSPRSGNQGSLPENVDCVQRGLLGMEEGKLSRGVDAEVLPDVRQTYSTMTENIEIPKTREEKFAEATFEWVKTERSGDLSKFKEFREENGIEYVVFQDNTRVNAALIGDVVMMHNNEFELMTYKEDFEPAPQTQVTPVAAPYTAPPAVPSTQSNPVHELLKKAKKKKQKVTLTVELNLPAEDVYRIVSENFDNGHEEVLNFILGDLTEEAIRTALTSALKDKYSKTTKQ